MPGGGDLERGLGAHPSCSEETNHLLSADRSGRDGIKRQSKKASWPAAEACPRAASPKDWAKSSNWT